LRHGIRDQAQRRKSGEGGKPGQRQGGSEGAARDDQRFAPGLARSRPNDKAQFASLKRQLWQWQAGIAGCGRLNFA
jgi:hypothetical protein